MEHYFSEMPNSSKYVQRRFSEVLRGNRIMFFTLPGVFSKSKVDEGSKLLIEKCIVNHGWNVLDLGCGYGAVGISIAKAFKVSLVMADVNERALELARMNAEANDVKAQIVKSNIYEGLIGMEGSFDTILINPPQKAGLHICLAMIDKAPEFLKKGGFLQVVVRPRRGGFKIVERMNSVFGNCEKIAERGEFAIYASKYH
ncbi:MAG: methyltransferase [Candidatus Woesearchaeota archaeon]